MESSCESGMFQCGAGLGQGGCTPLGRHVRVVCQCAIKPDLETYIVASQIAVAVVMKP